MEDQKEFSNILLDLNEETVEATSKMMSTLEYIKDEIKRNGDTR